MARERGAGEQLRLVLIGAGWITSAHLDALDRLGRTQLVSVASANQARAEATAAPRGAAAYVDLPRMLDEQRPDVAFVCVPPVFAAGIGEQLLDRGIPFLTEKPLAATDDDAPERLAARIAKTGLVVAVGYHLRALEALPRVRERFATAPPQLLTARWLDSTPDAAWWQREEEGGGQVVEQATHFYDLARHLIGDATVVGAASTREDAPTPAGADVVDATAAVLRFESGAVGSFANTRRLASALAVVELASPGLLTTIRRTGSDPGRWEVTFGDEGGVKTMSPGRDPYERQAEAFLDAVAASDPRLVLSSYADALRSYRLTRAVVAATGRGG